MQPFTFRTENQRTIHVVIERVIDLRAPLVETDSPDVALFQLFHRTRDVGYFRNRQMFACTCRRFGDGSRDACGAALWDNDAVCAGCICGAEDCSQVVRVFDAVEHYDEGICPRLAPTTSSRSLYC